MSGAEDNTNRSSILENDGASIGAASSMTFHMDDGTDDATNKYLNIPGGQSFGIEVIPTVACSITELNGRILKVAASVGTLGYRSNNLKVRTITITAGSATVVEVSGKGGN